MTAAVALDGIARRYRRFAETEAHGRSSLYEALSLGVAADEQVLAFLATLPPAKQQPNLLLGAMRLLFGVIDDWSGFRRTLLDHGDAVRDVMLTHGTQTNEPARCAVLLPILARLPQPLAIVEVGASAGLCLLPDFYGYDYGAVRLDAAVPDAPVLRCATSANTPLPDTVPSIAWRAGLDLNPLDASDPEQAAWLEALVWPEHTDRLARLHGALRIAAERRPRIVRGDLRGGDLAALCREAPKDATLVVFHTAVLAYVADAADRRVFAERVGSLCRCWIANEAPQVFPDAAARAGAPPHPGWFLLSVNGNPVAWAEPHGAGLAWIQTEGG